MEPRPNDALTLTITLKMNPNIMPSERKMSVQCYNVFHAMSN